MMRQGGRGRGLMGEKMKIGRLCWSVSVSEPSEPGTDTPAQPPPCPEQSRRGQATRSSAVEETDRGRVGGWVKAGTVAHTRPKKYVERSSHAGDPRGKYGNVMT